MNRENIGNRYSQPAMTLRSNTATTTNYLKKMPFLFPLLFSTAFILNSLSIRTMASRDGAFSAGFKLYSAPSADKIENSVGRPNGILICKVCTR
uniref:Uncharacterized protein n=1 Tax=Zea mays TaxID=4577 RepID=C4J2Z4_MAIZE|nr:unknown [Zea mays]